MLKRKVRISFVADYLEVMNYLTQVTDILQRMKRQTLRDQRKLHSEPDSLGNYEDVVHSLDVIRGELRDLVYDVGTELGLNGKKAPKPVNWYYIWVPDTGEEN